MQPSPVNILSDRITLTLRWLILVGLVLVLGEGGGKIADSILLVVLLGLWNIILLVFTIINKRIWQHEYVCVAIDILIALALTWFVESNGAPFAWAGILPVIIGAYYFGRQGGLYIATGMVVIQSAALIIKEGAFAVIGGIWLPAVVMLVIGLVFGIFAERFTYLIDRSGELAQAEKKKKENLERDRIKTLYQITSAMTTTLNYERVLDMALDLTAKAVTKPGDEISLISACLLFEGEEELTVGSARRFTPSDMRVALPAKQGVIYEALRSGQPRQLYAPKEDPEIQRLVALRECGVVFVYPLRTSAEMFGVLLFGHPDETYFDESNSEIIEIIGRQALVALQNAHLYRNLEQEKERMMEIQEEARKQLARDLHDGPTQSVAAIAMRVNFARRLIDRDAHAAGDELFKIEDLARRTTKEIRHMLFTLRPLVLETNGLIAALKSMAEKMKETYDQKVIIDAHPEVVSDVEMGKQGVIFYIAEEAVNNARKHAEAEVISVGLRREGEALILLEIKDDGVGFNVGEVDSGYEKRGSLGMVNMRERTELLNGKLQVLSKVGEGTRIRVWIPLNDDAAEKLRSGSFR